jgi:dipeptidyl aminopeptidase/acylaminoacyl peptidase
VLQAGAVGNSNWPAVAPKGGRLAFSRSTSDSNIWRVPLDRGRAAGAPERLVASTMEDEVAQYSPDGRRIAFTSNRSGVHEVWICEADASNPVQLTSFGVGMTGSPHWSPDQKQIVFDANADGQFDVYAINTAGGSPRRLTHDPADDALAAFSPDGRRIFFASRRTGAMQIWHMPAQGGEAVQLTTGGGTNPSASPDGSLVYYWKNQQLWSVPACGGPESLVLDSVAYLEYAVTPHGIYFVPMCGGISCKAIEFFDFSSRRPTRVLSTATRIGSGISVSPGEKFLLYTLIEQIGSDLMLIENFR